MERAFLLLNPSQGLSGGHKTVTAARLSQWGKEKARLNTYLCPHPTCHVLVSTVFPNPESNANRHRTQVPQPHFRVLSKHSHSNDCPYSKSAEKTDTTCSPDTGGTRTPASAAKAPSVFAEEFPSSNGYAQRHLGEDSAANFEGSQFHNSNSSSVRESISTAYQLSTLAGFWHENKENVSDLPLAVKDCRGRIYATVFKQLNSQVTNNYSLNERHIYWAVNPSVKPYSNDFFLRFGLKSPDRLSLQFRLPKYINGIPLLPDFVDRLNYASKEPITIYALGRFQKHPKMAYLELTPLSVYHVWAELGSPIE